MRLEDKHIVYFIGIGGIGMSALARWFMHTGKKVFGYDKTPTPLTHQLEKEGAIIHYHDSTETISEDIRQAVASTLIVYTPAVPVSHSELNFFRSRGFDVLKRSEVLGLITQNLYSVAVAGTHGKTTTSSMIAHILKTAGRASLSIMGGILQGYETNLIMEGKPTPDTIAVLEADEYDRSFLRLSPSVAVVTSTDADHLDIYGKHEALKDSFREFVGKVKTNGHIYLNQSLEAWLKSENPTVTMHTYALQEGLNRAQNIRIENATFKFDYRGEKAIIENITIRIPGFHNVENAIAAISVALQLGIGTEIIKEAIGSFKGVKRRFEYHINTDHLVYIDDYAHHPKEIEALLRSVRSLYPGKRITAVFQPHLFSRTRDFADGFAESLDLADEVLLMNIYPARELPIEGVSTEIIMRKMQPGKARLVEDAELLKEIKNSTPEVLITIGAGDIDRFVLNIKSMLETRI